MRAPFRRFLVAVPIAAILVFSLAGMASATVVSKSIVTTTGECFKDPITGDGQLANGDPCGAAVYDSANGFTGHITFNEGEGAITINDFICENIKNQTGGFTAVTGDYTLALSVGGVPLSGSPWSYSITTVTSCEDGNHQASDPVALTVPDGTGTYTVAYSLLLDGFDPANFTGDNSILNRVEEAGANQANSASVAPPQGTPPVPEAPLAILLIGTGGLTAVWYVSRKLRQSVSLTAA